MAAANSLSFALMPMPWMMSVSTMPKLHSSRTLAASASSSVTMAPPSMV